MSPLTQWCLCLVVCLANGEVEHCESSGTCAGTDQSALLQRHVGIAEASNLEEVVASAEDDDSVTEVESDNDEDEEDPDPNANKDCSTLMDQSTCSLNGCKWTDAFEGEAKDDGSGELSEKVCADEEEVEMEEHDKVNVSSLIQEHQYQTESADEGTQYCRRRRVHRRRGPCPWARRRRTPTTPRRRRAPVPGMVKVSLTGKVATQSSTGWGGKASRGIDGNSNSQWGGASCTHTNNAANAWWQVDLGKSQSISGIKITNRGDCCGSRLNGFSLEIDGKSCATNVAIAQGATKTVPCSGTGQVIRVKPKGKNYLTICELEVYSPEAPTEAPTPAPTVAPTVTPTVAPTVAPTEAASGQAPKAPNTATAAPTPNAPNTATGGIFDIIDADNNQKINRAELKNALDSGRVIDRDELKKAVDAGRIGSPVTTVPTTAPTPAPTNAPAPEKAPAPASNTVPTQAQKDAIVQKHNSLRALMGASDMTKMTWDDTLANAAQTWAAGCPSGHSQNRDNAGENIAGKWSSNFQLTASTDFTPSVQSWYDEYADAGTYKTGGSFAGFGPCTGTCGHYTQVVWAAANKIGCGVKFCPHSTGMAGYKLVCQYGTSVPGGHGGNMGGATLFTKGNACSKCPTGFGTCSSNLCSSGV